MQVIIVVISFLSAAVGVTSMYKGFYIPSVKLVLWSGLSAIAIHFVISKIQPNKNKKLDKLMGFSITILGVMLLSSFVYSSWKLEKFLSYSTRRENHIIDNS